MNQVWGDFARMIFHIQVQVQEPEAPPPFQSHSASPASSSATGGGRVNYSSGASASNGASAVAAAAGVVPEAGAVAGSEQPAMVAQRHVDANEPGRNDPCWCGSGKKYKRCHGA
jgi:preprotein translocase subunit SecA